MKPYKKLTEYQEEQVKLIQSDCDHVFDKSHVYHQTYTCRYCGCTIPDFMWICYMAGYGRGYDDRTKIIDRSDPFPNGIGMFKG